MTEESSGQRNRPRLKRREPDAAMPSAVTELAAQRLFELSSAFARTGNQPAEFRREQPC
ncbi:hypothetical protein [Amycolatopsis sp. DSM 110486]|uniref:hypothetical protein n=1 Tax=Amycolatopsis sp. DSM 110486 TaxID=2865832 RepID=UPI001C696433|nr:hypothetical protein [Amycolatopsis sp. DSM 110486]QYN23186.1 hypothetical protein K1T34_12435 [Amycolatopsis sp. DSM 110486]